MAHLRNHRASPLVLAFPVMALVVLALLISTSAVAFAGSSASPYLTRFHTVGDLASTVPTNGDINPYGVAVVPHSVGNLSAGNVLVSNFNNASNAQGTGSTIMQVSPSSGAVSPFAKIAGLSDSACPGGVGLTTALGVLQRGWVIVGSLPTTDGTAATAQAGCLIVLDSMGNVKETFAKTNTMTPDINGPWDMTLADTGATATLYVTNVLNGTVAGGGAVVDDGTVLRINLNVPLQGAGLPTVQQETVIGSGFPERTDPAALVIGPTGLALSGGTLYVADSLDNRIAAIDNASTPSPGTVRTVSVGGALNDPLGMTLAPNGDLVAVNGNDGKAVEVTQSGAQVAVKVLDNTVTHHGKNGGGALFGLAPVPTGGGLYFVDDGSNTLNLLH
jgi:sugar lactone lactonase YvrE